LISALFGAL